MFKRLVTILVSVMLAASFAGVVNAHGWHDGGHGGRDFYGNSYRGHHGSNDLGRIGIALGLVGLGAAISNGRPEVQRTIIYSNSYGYPDYPDDAQYERVPVYCTYIDGYGYRQSYVCQYRVVRIEP